jgi:hypothetical protein
MKLIYISISRGKTMASQIYTFKISLATDVYRVIELAGQASLHDFAEAIINAYEFDFDHCFGFYSATHGNIIDSDEAYELFVDIEGEGLSPHACAVKTAFVQDVFQKGKCMTFLFDYGDEWKFLVECQDVVDALHGKEYPCVLDGKGVVEQYHVHGAGCNHAHH